MITTARKRVPFSPIKSRFSFRDVRMCQQMDRITFSNISEDKYTHTYIRFFNESRRHILTNHEYFPTQNTVKGKLTYSSFTTPSFMAHRCPFHLLPASTTPSPVIKPGLRYNASSFSSQIHVYGLQNF